MFLWILCYFDTHQSLTLVAQCAVCSLVLTKLISLSCQSHNHCSRLSCVRGQAPHLPLPHRTAGNRCNVVLDFSPAQDDDTTPWVFSGITLLLFSSFASRRLASSICPSWYTGGGIVTKDVLNSLFLLVTGGVTISEKYATESTAKG